MKKLFLVCLLIVFVCSGSGCGTHRVVENDTWIAYQGIIVGTTNLREVEQVNGEPAEKTMVNESVQLYSYEGYDLIAQNQILQAIFIHDETAPKLWDSIGVGDSLDALCKVLPVEPMEVSISDANMPGSFPEHTGKFSCILVTAYQEDETTIYEKQLLFQIADAYCIKFDIDVERNIITAITLNTV